jgi:hypothetical protein
MNGAKTTLERELKLEANGDVELASLGASP